MFISSSTKSSAGRLNTWKSDIGTDISLEEWKSVYLKAHTQTVNTRLQLLQVNWSMRTYLTLVKLHSFDNNMPDTWVNCGIEKGTLFHCLWECEEIQKFWREVTLAINSMVNITLNPDPK